MKGLCAIVVNSAKTNQSLLLLNSRFTTHPPPILIIYGKLSDNRLFSSLNHSIYSDGLTDVIEYTASSYWTYRAKNGGFSSYESNASFSKSNPYFVPSNTDNRNYFHQLVALRNDGKVDRFSYPRNDTKEKLLTGAVSSLGVVGKNYYEMINESSSLYTQGYGAVYPYENFQGPLFVPETREQYFNGALNENNSYAYENAVIHKQGLGFRGFEKIYFYDNMRWRTQSRKFDPYNFGVLKEEDSPAATVTNTYSVSVASNKTAKIQLTNRSALDKLKNNTVTAAYTYDTYGSPLTETIDYGGGITQSVSNTFYNNTNESGYLLGFLYDKTKTTNRNGSTCSERYYVSSYGNGQPNVVIQYANGNQVSYETYGYDAQGNATSGGVNSYTSTNTLTTSSVYDSYGRKTKETDPLGLTTTYEYNSTNGSLSAVKNHKGQATTYTYDAFIRQTGYTYPDGTLGGTMYSWESKGSNGLYCVRKWEIGKPYFKTYYDAFGRTTASSELNFNSTETIAEKQYDSYGRLQKVSLPYIGTAASNWNTYQYDSYDRITSYTEASGRKTTYSYSGNSVTTTKDGISFTQTFDTQGNLISVSDPAGTITYNLRPDGQPASIVASGNARTSLEYDSYGRRISIADPSAGKKYYTYSAAGNLAKETDANSKIISYQYDTYNRLTLKTQPEFSTTYKYDSDGFFISETSTNGTSTTYQYDTYGKIYKEKEMVPDGKWLEKTYTYQGGNLGSISYATNSTNNLTTENCIYSNDHLTETRLNETIPIWKLNEINTFGQPASVTTGNFNRTYSFDAYGTPTGRTAGSFQNHTYSFDATKGNLSYRKDNTRGLQENFSYDNLSRLTDYTGKTIEYDVMGNITNKTDVEMFQYDIFSGRPYTLSRIASPTNLVQQRRQSVTYTSFQRPATITEGEYTATFTYNSRNERVKRVQH